MKAVDLTPFGKFNRKLRIDHDEKLKEMAQKLGVTASFLSAVEIGYRSIPKSWGEKISKIYDLNDEQKQILNNSILQSKFLKF